MGSIAIVAEKPSVARDIARVVGARQNGEGYLHGGGYVVTWAVGHLVALAQPHEIRPEWRQWRRETLPILPREWPLVVYEQTRDQFGIVSRILNSPKIDSVICATDAGREGELIFRYVYEAAGSTKPVRRLWVSSLTEAAIREGLANLKDGAEYDPLADAARGRSRADWLVGMNLSRAYTLACGDDLSVGRVQTPTLAIVVERELAIQSFVPEDYREVVATFSPGGASYKGTWFRTPLEKGTSLADAARLPADGEEAERIAERARKGAARIASLDAETQRTPPPLFYDLTELQRHANRLYAFSAQKTLELAQALYERHKAITYPRTDSRHLSQSVAATLPVVVRAIAGRYEGLVADGSGERPLGRRYVDDTKVTDHHAILPTPQPPGALPADEARIYDLVCRRLLAAWHDEHIARVTKVVTVIATDEAGDSYASSGTAIEQVGWKVLDIQPRRRQPAGDERDQPLPAGLAVNQPQQVLDVSVLAKRTRPPKRLTEATLLTAMETAGKTLDDRELADAMKESGLGTPATRASIIELLLTRGYITRDGKSLAATPKGIRLIEIVHPEAKSPAMTGQWEAFLKRIERRQAALGPFLEGIEEYVRTVVGKVLSSEPVPPPVHRPTAPTNDLNFLLHERFGFPSFRPSQEDVCRAALEGDVLVVMPTGSGKSLCYQLPGAALGSGTLVVSPLIALMEDQVEKLLKMGFRVARIHSGRSRQESREAAIAWRDGQLDFLFIAPERLRVPGFPELLARRKPALVAIDEAHCISEWGHDFRPDYRRLGQHLPALRPAHVIALTATATPIVQDDIVRQLGMDSAKRFIQGFRRDNIAIEVVEVPSGERALLTQSLLQEPERRPAIVYVPTRRQAESMARDLNASFRTAPYHAGLDTRQRKQTQEDFLANRLETVVATIAFGMGIDKPNVRTVIHMALPSSVEAYYQEIGRAGRDGAPSRAILMHTYSDRMTHDYFFGQSYPEADELAEVYRKLPREPEDRELVAKRLGFDDESFSRVLEKLWIHGGAVIEIGADLTERVGRGADNWRPSYAHQREYKRDQLRQIQRYTDASECRMLSLVRHFGDLTDARRPCGLCDFCQPGHCLAQTFRTPTAVEQAAAEQILAVVRTGKRPTARMLHEQFFAETPLDRTAIENLLNGLARAEYVHLEQAVFEKEGRRIPFTRVGPGSKVADARIEFEVKKPVDAVAPAKKKTKPAKKKASKKTKAAVQEAPAELRERLRQWRLEEARKRGLPAFRILTDRSLDALLDSRPASAQELLAVPGVGLAFVEKYGAAVFRLLHGG